MEPVKKWLVAGDGQRRVAKSLTPSSERPSMAVGGILFRAFLPRIWALSIQLEKKFIIAAAFSHRNLLGRVVFPIMARVLL